MSPLTLAILLVNAVLTLAGDWLIKHASLHQLGLGHPLFVLGAVLYGLPAVGWYVLMRTQSLSAIGVLYSASTIILLSGLGVLGFGEALSWRTVVGVGLAVASVVVIAGP